MDPAISICRAAAAPGRPRCGNTPFGVMVKSASKLAAAVLGCPRCSTVPKWMSGHHHPVSACSGRCRPPTSSPPTSRAPPGSPHRLAAPPGGDGGQAELATVRLPGPKPMTAAVTNRDLKVNANRLTGRQPGRQRDRLVLRRTGVLCVCLRGWPDGRQAPGFAMTVRLLTYADAGLHMSMRYWRDRSHPRGRVLFFV